MAWFDSKPLPDLPSIPHPNYTHFKEVVNSCESGRRRCNDQAKRTITFTCIFIIIGLVGLGFTAMSTNPPFVVPQRIPNFFFALAALTLVVLLVYLTWGFITRLRLQAPIILINQQGNTNVVAIETTGNQFTPIQLTHDNVLWEDNGRKSAFSQGIIVEGPFYPNDLTPLATKRGWDRTVDTHLRKDDYFSDRTEPLFCLECNAEYILSNETKRLGESRSEVSNLFEGMRRRNQQGQEG